jgi:hypothetical protein
MLVKSRELVHVTNGESTEWNYCVGVIPAEPLNGMRFECFTKCPTTSDLRSHLEGA